MSETAQLSETYRLPTLPTFAPEEIDCATAVMLKILDGKCKMMPDEKVIMATLYNAVKDQTGLKLGGDLHDLIATACAYMDDDLREVIYEQRLYAETMISRPVMKAFKRRLREVGILPQKVSQA